MPYTIQISPIDHVHMKVKCLDDEGVNLELSEFFTFFIPGYKFMPMYRRGLWDGKVRLYHLYTGRLYVGLLHLIRLFASERGYSIKLTPEFSDIYRSTEKPISFEDSENYFAQLKLCASDAGVLKDIIAHDYQVEAFQYAVNNRRTLLLSPTSSGKSLILYALVRWYLEKDENNRILLIVPTTSLVEQMYKDFSEYSSKDFWDVKDDCHRIYQGKSKSTDKRVIISTWQSIYKLPKEWFDQFTVILGDECHGFKSNSLKGILEKTLNAPYKFGTTGTLDGTKTHKLVLEGLFGPVHKVITTSELMDRGTIANMKINCMVLKHPDAMCKLMKGSEYNLELKFLVENEARNKLLRNLVASLNGNTLLLFRFVDHGKLLFDLIKSKVGNTRKVFFVAGSIETIEREAIRIIVEKEKDAIIVASYGTFSTGINIKNLAYIVFASPSKSRIRTLQSIGRGLRKSSTKDKMELFDISDNMQWKKKKNHTLNHFLSRLEIYASENFPFKIFKIDLKYDC